MKEPLKAGDRVAVYDIHRDVGTVVKVDETQEMARVKSNTRNNENWYHIKQCRRLRPKKKAREIWVRNEFIPAVSLLVEGKLGVTCVERGDDPAWTKFREVLP